MKIEWVKHGCPDKHGFAVACPGEDQSADSLLLFRNVMTMIILRCLGQFMSHETSAYFNKITFR